MHKHVCETLFLLENYQLIVWWNYFAQEIFIQGHLNVFTCDWTRRLSVPMSFTVIFSFSNTIRSTWKASDFRQTPTWSKLSHLAADTWHYETNVLMTMVAALSSDVCRLLHMCHVSPKVGMKWPEWALIMSFFKLLLCFFLRLIKHPFLHKGHELHGSSQGPMTRYVTNFGNYLPLWLIILQRINSFWGKNRLFFHRVCFVFLFFVLCQTAGF